MRLGEGIQTTFGFQKYLTVATRFKNKMHNVIKMSCSLTWTKELQNLALFSKWYPSTLNQNFTFHWLLFIQGIIYWMKALTQPSTVCLPYPTISLSQKLFHVEQQTTYTVAHTIQPYKPTTTFSLPILGPAVCEQPLLEQLSVKGT